jgi:tetratricopeptide (TPR) repeat protein
MNSSSAATFKKIIRFEDLRASTGAFAKDDQSPEKAIHEAQIRRWDTRQALAKSSLDRLQVPLSYIRSLLQRGNLEQARTALHELWTSESEPSLDVKAQILFEETRLAFFEGQWNEVILTSDRAMQCNPAPVTQLALFQLRASAYFELGLFSDAARAIEESELLGKLFPYAISYFYTQIMKVRVVARDVGVKQAELLLNRIFEDAMKRGRLDLDLVLTYLRAKIDLNRLDRRSIAHESRACFYIADAIGDKLYSALAELDFQSAFAKDASELSRLVVSHRKQFQRVDQLVKGILGEEPRSITASTIGETLGNQKTLREHFQGEYLQEDSFRSVCLLLNHHNLYIDLDGPVFHRLKPKGQSTKSLIALAPGIIAKSEFFRLIWGNQAYSPRLHDPLINSVVHRMRKEYGIEVQVRDGNIQTLKPVIVI